MTTQKTLLNDTTISRVRQLFDRYIKENKIAGAVAVVAGPGGDDDRDPVVIKAGVQNLETGVPMGPDTIFRIYSLTKPVTSVAALMLVEQGKLRLDDAVADYIPAFADVNVFVAETDDGIEVEPPVLPPTVQDLLMHTSGLGGVHVTAGVPLADEYRAARLDDRSRTIGEQADKLADIPLLFQPGTAWRYGLSSDVLGRVIEVASGQSFGTFLRENIFEPLDMPDTGFFVPAEKAERLATVYSVGARGDLRPMGAADQFTTKPALEPGGSGLVSTPRDYLHFAQMLVGRGTWRGRRLLNPETIESMATNRLPAELLPYRLPWPHAGHFTEGAGFGLGVRVLLDPDEAGVPGSPGEYGWAGAANTFLWVDPVKQKALLLFTQAFPFLHTDLDRQFKRIVYDSSAR